MTSYWLYLQETLGVEHVVLPATEKSNVDSAADNIAEALHLNAKVKIHFQVVSAHDLTAEEHSLFHKIMEALKVPSADYIMTSGPVETDPKAQRCVIFTDFGDRFGEWIEHHGQTILRTYSLHAMLQDSALKKPVWSHLQSLKH